MASPTPGGTPQPGDRRPGDASTGTAPVSPAARVPAGPPAPPPPTPQPTAATQQVPPGAAGFGPRPQAQGLPGSGHRKTSSRPADPLAVALGNATLFGVGYLLKRRKLAAVGAAVVSITLMVIIGLLAPPAWLWHALLLLWWLTMIVHGALTARRPTRRTPSSAEVPPLDKPLVRRHRLIAATAAAIVLASAVGVAVEGRLLEASGTRSHQAGDCLEAIPTLERVGARHRIVDPLAARRAEDNLEACRILRGAIVNAKALPEQASDMMARYAEHPAALWPDASVRRVDLLLRAAETEFTLSLRDDDIERLAHGVELLTRVLELDSSRVDDVDTVLAAYARHLPGAQPCDATALFDWIAEHDPLDGFADRVAAVAPPIMLDCGERLLPTAPYEARDVYQALLDRYPEADVADSARDGLDEAEAAIEAGKLRGKFSGTRSTYCDDPVPYRKAPPYQGSGPHLFVLGEDPEMPDTHIPPEYRTNDTVLRHSLPHEWYADEPTEATLVLCATSEKGQLLTVCAYEGDLYLPLHRQRIHVRAYEVRTAEIAFELTMEIGNNGCPRIYYSYFDPPTMLYAPTVADQVRSALRPKIAP